MTPLFIILTALCVLVVAVIAALELTPVRRRYVLRFQTGRDLNMVVKRRLFPWPTDNVVFGGTLYAAHPDTLNDATLRHEGVHVWQYSRRGWWWVLTNPSAREREAHEAERAGYPILKEV